jgi:hypothetical protein
LQLFPSHDQGVCESQGEVNADEIDNIVIDSDGVHRLH